MLVETRGASKEKAVEELLKTVPAMQQEADRKLNANVSLLQAQISKEKIEFERLGAAAQAALSKEFDAAQKEQLATIKSMDKDLRARLEAQSKQSETLTNQLDQAREKQREAEMKEFERLNRALQERVRTETALEAKFTVLHGQVLALELMVKNLSK